MRSTLRTAPRRLRRALWTAAIAAAVTTTAAPAQIDDPIPFPIDPAPGEISLALVADGMTAPNWGTSAPGLPARVFFVTDQDGILWQVDLASGNKRVFLDVSDRIVELGVGGKGTFDERGLLGVAFHPDYATNGRFYVFTSEPFKPNPDFTTQPPGVDPDCESVITEWRVPNPTNPRSRPHPDSDRVLLRFYKPDFNHNGGTVTFGPDRMLYISVGDGGAADDEGPGHGEVGNGRDSRTVLGTILRIDPLGDNAPNGQYGIPADNPFIGRPPFGGQDGCDGDGFCDEIWAYGLRNPFRVSFDIATGAFIIPDVGQNDIEEVNIGIKAANYGWNWKEGTFCFDGNGLGDGFVVDCAPGQVPPGLIDPIAQYDHDEGLAVIGGFVYRGSRIPPLDGRYIFGDFARTFANDGRIFVLGPGQKILELLIAGQGALGEAVLGFGQDARGEVYVMTNETSVPFGNTGKVYRIAPAP